jgi:pyruvate kinase
MGILKSTKIVCTIGPKSQDEGTMTRMVKSGMDVVRMNLSHGSHDFHRRTIELTKRISKKTGRYIGILLDLQGPKIRTRGLEKEPLVLNRGQRITLTTRDIPGNWEYLSVNYENLPQEVQAGETILLDDGQIKLKVVGKDVNNVVCSVVEGGVIRSYRGINLPDTELGAPSLTAKDIEDLDFGLRNGVDLIALSFVRRAGDIEELKSRIKKKGRELPVIAKIEKPEAVKNIDGIVDSAAGIMVARGDLGAETSPQDVPVLQKQIITHCNRKGKPVITATQMLESMVSHPSPTRAEASDVANAIFDGTDCVMLSGETAVGEYPVKAVSVMAEIAHRAEAEIRTYSTCRGENVTSQTVKDDVPDAVCCHACKITDLVRPNLIVGFTLSGRTAALLSKYRPSVPIIAMSPDEDVLNRLSLYWGVYGVRIDILKSADRLFDRAERLVLEHGFCREGDTVVFVGGVPVLSGVTTNMLKVHTVKIGDRNL